MSNYQVLNSIIRKFDEVPTIINESHKMRLQKVRFYLRFKMVLVSKVMERWNELCIGHNGRYRTGEEIHILK